MPYNAKKIIKVGSITVLFLFIVTFAFFRSKDLIFGVKIKNVSLVDGVELSEKSQKVTGNAKNAIKLSLNGREISLDQDGNFDETIILASGYNIINIKAEDKFKHEDEKNYQLILKN